MLDYTKYQNKPKLPNSTLLNRSLNYILSNIKIIVICVVLYFVFFEPELTSNILSNWINKFIVKTIKDINY